MTSLYKEFKYESLFESELGSLESESSLIKMVKKNQNTHSNVYVESKSNDNSWNDFVLILTESLDLEIILTTLRSGFLSKEYDFDIVIMSIMDPTLGIIECIVTDF